MSRDRRRLSAPRQGWGAAFKPPIRKALFGKPFFGNPFFGRPFFSKALCCIIALGWGLNAKIAEAGACDDARDGRTLVHFETGVTDIPSGFFEKLDRFASVARHKYAVCVKGIVDAQSDNHAVNRQIARSRALNIKLYLTSRGVPERAIEIETQDRSFTLFGTLDPNQPANRRVQLTHD